MNCLLPYIIKKSKSNICSSRYIDFYHNTWSSSSVLVRNSIRSSMAVSTSPRVTSAPWSFCWKQGTRIYSWEEQQAWHFAGYMKILKRYLKMFSSWGVKSGSKVTKSRHTSIKKCILNSFCVQFFTHLPFIDVSQKLVPPGVDVFDLRRQWLGSYWWSIAKFTAELIHVLNV